MDFDSPPKNTQQRNSCYLLSMEARYPFDKHLENQTDCLVKFKLTVPFESYKSTQNLLKKYYSLKHEALIDVVNIFESKEGWDIHYEYIPMSFASGLRKMGEQEITRAKKILMNAAEYLMMKDIRPVFNEYNIGFVKNFPKMFLNFHCLKEINLEHKFNDIVLQLELELETLFKQFVSKQQIETMDEFESMGKVQYNRTQLIDKKIAQIRRRMSDNNLSLEKVTSLGNLKQFMNEQITEPKIKKQRKACLKDFIKSPEAKIRMSPNKYMTPKVPPSQVQTSLPPTYPSLTSTKNIEIPTLFSPRNDTSQRYSEFDTKQISIMSKKRKATFDMKFKESLLKTQQTLNYFQRNK